MVDELEAPILYVRGMLEDKQAGLSKRRNEEWSGVEWSGVPGSLSSRKCE
jgi:hypothetical protein